LDLAGNVAEWCGDMFGEDFYSTPEATVGGGVIGRHVAA